MQEYVAKTLFGLEGVLAEELRVLGATDISMHNRAVGFKGDRTLLYKANYFLRTALKILVPLGEGTVNNEDQLYQYVRSIPWNRFMAVTDTLAVDVALQTGIFKHSQFVAQKIKDAVVDQFRDQYGVRPSVDLDSPTLRINAYISNNTIKLARDSSGDSLHRRGYRSQQGPAPMNEVLAAGLVLLSEWNRNEVLVDFMCGSGTIAVEAALMAAHIPPGDLRMHYGFQKWKDYDSTLFNEISGNVDRHMDPPEPLVYASDVSPEAVRIAERHARNAGIHKWIHYSRCHFNDCPTPPAPGKIIINPPYGERIDQVNLNETYTQMGDRFKKGFPGFDAWVISSNAEAMKCIGLKPSKKIILYNGQLECRFNRYSLYTGSKKRGDGATSE
jgi:putative N6-adenine-specific DNA methylase